ncbi:PREDICTED: arylsulfatase I-like [Cyprinodon variegatus]|uniref:arylsulfatase I-like n=1 Tax=Cyprinodon variegatus TaxID=28743 RepID=UPI0007429D9B|nr:PREDICTED: arylsulfatase I-like [Cyprinodon variegatus]
MLRLFEGIRKAFLSVLFLGTSIILLGGVGCFCELDGKVDTEENGQPRPPHLIFIMVDDQGYGDIGYHGSDIHTPALDRLAAEGVKLENYYVQPICSPSRSQLMTGRVKKILQNHNSSTPLFLYLSLQAAHTPLQAPDLFLHHYKTHSNRQRRHYAAMLSCLDDGVAQMVKEMKASGLYQNSVLIYSSDNGGQPLSGGSNWPLRGGKGTYWEGGIRAVGFVHSPLLKRKGIVSKALIHVSDWYPTLLRLAGDLQSYHDLDGHNVWGSINEGLPCPRKEILFNIDPVSRKPGEPYDKAVVLNGFGIWDTAVRAALRVGDWKLLTGNVGDGDWIPPQALPAGRERWQKLEKQRNRLGKSVWLFNISADPYERFDLAEIRPRVVKHLLLRLAEYNHTAVMAKNPPDDPMADPELHGGVWSPWLGQEGWKEDTRVEEGKKEKTVKFKHCKLCKLKALFKKVGSRLERKNIF